MGVPLTREAVHAGRGPAAELMPLPMTNSRAVPDRIVRCARFVMGVISSSLNGSSGRLDAFQSADATGPGTVELQHTLSEPQVLRIG